MAQVNGIVLEIQTRALNQYHHLKSFPVSIGRALDNDIILSDPSVSPHHLTLDRGDDGQLIVENLSEENGTRVNGKYIDETVATDTPARLRLGNRRARLLSTDAEVEPTSVRNCSGWLSVLCNPAWSIVLVALTLLLNLYDSFVQTIFQKDIIYYVSNFLPSVLGLMALTLVIAGLTRLAIHRWEIGPALSLAALFMLVPQLLAEVGHFFDYFFTSNVPGEMLITLNNFLLVPLLLYVYLRRVNHSAPMAALGIALLLSSPLLAYQASDFVDKLTIAGEFSDDAEFNRTLCAKDVRLQPTIVLDDYLSDANRLLAVEGEASYKSP